MVDDVNLRNRRARAHKRGDHSLCRPQRCPDAPGASNVVKLHTGDQVRETGLVAKVREQLGQAADTMEGLLALELAAAIMRGGHTAQGLAKLSQELRQVVATATGDHSTPGKGSSAPANPWRDRLGR